MWDPVRAKALAVETESAKNPAPSPPHTTTTSTSTPTSTFTPTSTTTIPTDFEPPQRATKTDGSSSTVEPEEVPSEIDSEHSAGGTTISVTGPGTPSLRLIPDAEGPGGEPKEILSKHVLPAVAAMSGVLVISFLSITLVCFIRRRRRRETPTRLASSNLSAVAGPVQSRTTSVEVVQLLPTVVHTRLEDVRDPPPVYALHRGQSGRTH